MLTEQYTSHVRILYSNLIKCSQQKDNELQSPGSGLLLQQEYIITTASVVAQALGLRNPSQLPIGKAVYIHWTYASITKTVKAFIRYTSPIIYEGQSSYTYLLCVLQLASKHELPKNIHAVTLSTLYFDLHNCFVSTLVHAKNEEQNIVYKGYCVDEAGQRLRIDWKYCEQLSSDKPDLTEKVLIKKHCFTHKPHDGAPVWDTTKNNIIGLLNKHLDSNSYYLIPITQILTVCPNIYNASLHIKHRYWDNRVSSEELNRERSHRYQADQLIDDIQHELNNNLSLHIPLVKLHAVRQKFYQYRHDVKALQKQDMNESLWAEHLTQQAQSYLKKGSFPQALKYMQQAHAIHQKTVNDSSQNFQTYRALALSHTKLAELYRQQDLISRAREHYRQSMDMLNNMAARYPHNVETRRNLSIVYNKLGDIDFEENKKNQAQNMYHKALKLRLSLANTVEKSPQALRDLSVSYEKLGDMYITHGNFTKADKIYRKALEIKLSLFKSNPSSHRTKRDLSVAYEKMANLFYKKNCPNPAEKFYIKSLELRKELIDKYPSHLQCVQDLSISYEKLAALYQLMGNFHLAESACINSINLLTSITNRDQDSLQIKYALYLLNQRLGDVYLTQGDKDQAECTFMKSLHLITSLTKEKPTNTLFQKNKIYLLKKIITHSNAQQALIIELFKAYNQLGDQYKNVGDMNIAQTHYYASLKLYQQKIAKADSKYTAYQQDIVQTYWNLGIVSNNPSDKKDWLVKALKSAKQLVGRDKDKRITWVETIKAQLSRIKLQGHPTLP